MRAKYLTTACVAMMAASGVLQAQVDHQVPLNYNFRGMAHFPEAFAGAPASNADSILFRGISDRGLYWDIADPDAIGTQPLLGFSGITYNLFSPLGYVNTTAPNAEANGLDIVHLGSRVYYRGLETSANGATSTGQAVPWAPIFDVTMLTGDGTIATATTSVAHGLAVGQVIAIVGANPAAFSGEFLIASTPTDTTFTFACPASGTAAGSMFCNSTSTAVLSAISGSGSLATATTVWPHGFAIGNTVNITGSSNAGYNGQGVLVAPTPATGNATSLTFAFNSGNTGTTSGTQILAATLIHDTVDQVTTLSEPIVVDAGTEIGVLYNASDSGTQLAAFDAVLTFGAGPGAINVTARFGAPDWVGAQIDPPIISKLVTSQKRLTHTNGATYTTFRGVSGNDSAVLGAFSTANASPNMNVIEGIIGVQKVIDAGFPVGGMALTKITLRNPLFIPLQITALSFSGGVGTATIAATNNPFVVGQPIVISGVTPATYNVISKIASISNGTQFTFLAPGVPDGAGAAQRYANGMPVSALTTTTTTATVTTSAPHGLGVGDSVTITGSSLAASIGTYMVATAPTTTSFTYATIAAAGTSSAQMQVTRVGQNRGYAIYAATVRTGSPTVACCNNATGACATTLNSCPAGATQRAGTSCTPTTCPAAGQCCDLATSACSLIYGGSCSGSLVLGGTGSTCDTNPCSTIQLTPVGADGWGTDIVVEANAASAGSAAQAFDVPNSWAWYEIGLPGSTKGLPAGGAFTSLSTSVVSGQFRPYDGPNALLLDAGTPSGTLTLGAPIPYRYLAVFASSSNGGGTGTMVVTFTDSTSTAAIAFNAQDWFNVTTSNALNNLGRVKLTDGTFDDASAGNPRIYQTFVDLLGLGFANRSVQSITFTKPAASNTTAVMAISGQPTSSNPGACCATDGTCALATQVNCPSPSLFQGPDSACVSGSCPNAAHACCNTTTGNCTYTTNPVCPAGSNNAGPGTVCSPNTCPQAGACCANDGTCAVSNFAACASPSLFQGLGTACAAGMCPNAVGACCNNLFASCVYVTGSTCPAGFTFSGPGSVCAPNACVGLPASTETFDTTSTGGLPAGWQQTVVAGTAPGAGPAPAAWIVVADQSHSPSNSVFTNDIAGTYSQLLTAPVVTAAGNITLNLWARWATESATTAFDGWTVEVSINGAPFTNIQPTPADPNPWITGGYNGTINTGFQSPIAGQRAFFGNSGGGATPIWVENTAVITANPGDMVQFRFNMSEDSSATATGVWLDDITFANISMPSSGVCCRGSTCTTTITDAGACTGSLVAGQKAGAAFVSSSSTCNTGNISSTPCCYGNYNKVNGITVQDIFDFLSDWFAGGSFARVGGNGAPGPLTVQNIFDFLSNWFAGGCT